MDRGKNMTTMVIASNGRRPGASRERTTVRATPLQLTRRGRALVVGLFLLLALVIGLLRGAGSSQAASHVGNAPATRIVVVAPGESLWSIAARIDPAADPRETIARITTLNDLTGSVLPAGKALIVPAPAA